MKKNTESSLKSGVKYDNKKTAMFGLVSPFSMILNAMNLGGGFYKYAARNWEKGMSWTSVFSASMRHMWKGWMSRGSEEHYLDEEYKIPHFIMAMFGMQCLNEWYITHPEFDDRPIYTNEQRKKMFEILDNAEKALMKIAEQYKEKSADLKKQSEINNMGA